MLMTLFQRLLRHYALNKGMFKRSYIRFCNPDGVEYAQFLKRHGRFYSIGQDCSINSGVNITDPAYVRLGNNVRLSKCTILGHDGVVNLLNKAYGLTLDAVGKIDLKDNVFIGQDAIILPGVTIGPNSIVGAGAVVTKDVKEGDIVGGNPAKPISRMDDMVRRLQEHTESLPWAHLIRNRTDATYSSGEQELVAMRVKYFYPDK